MLEKSKKNNIIFHTLSIILLIALCVGCYFLMPNFLGRLIETFRDFVNSVVYFFCSIFGMSTKVVPTVTSLPKIPFFGNEVVEDNHLPSISILPNNFELFKSNFFEFFELFGSKENLFNYTSFLSKILLSFSKVLVIVLPLLLCIHLLFNRYFTVENNKYEKMSIPLKIFLSFQMYIYCPIKAFVLNFVYFIRSHKFYVYFFLFALFLFFNIVTVLGEFFAYYFYFSASFKFSTLYLQFYKLFIDINWIFKVPFFVWLIVAYLIFCHLRKNWGFQLLRHNEMKNRGFINFLAICTMIIGKMGCKKTTAITDMLLSQNAMFRDLACEKLLQINMLFPNFPWIFFEKDLQKNIINHTIFNLFSAKKFVENIENSSLYGYYGSVLKDNGLEKVKLIDCLKNYSQLYFIYIIQSTLIVSNYVVREDFSFVDKGNFPLWDNDFFKSTNDSFQNSKFSHILNFDLLRAGKKLIAENSENRIFEFGILGISEFGKERGNHLTNSNKKKVDEKANQLNDKMDYVLKMIRHPATVDNVPFVKVFADEQRAMSLEADQRELFDIVEILDATDNKIALPFYFLEQSINEFFVGKFLKRYKTYRFNRSDNTLFMYLYKNIVGRFINHYNKINNVFGYTKMKMRKSFGSGVNDFEECYYYLSNKKIYAKRFATDCFKSIYNCKLEKMTVGIDDTPTYASINSTFEEMKKEYSYFVEELMNFAKGEENEK